MPALPATLFRADERGHLTFVSDGWRALSFGPALGEAWLEAVDPEDRARVAAAWAEAVDARSALAVELRIGERTLLATAEPDTDGGWVGALHDVTEAARERAATHEVLRNIFDNAPIGMAIVALGPARRGKLLRVNRSLAGMLGAAKAELRAGTLLDLLDPEAHRARAQLAALLVGRGEPGLRVEAPARPGGAAEWLAVTVSIVQDPGGRPASAIAQIEDVTAHHQSDATLTRMARRDALTGLPNRVAFADRLRHALGRVRPGGRSPALLYIDLDGFKAVNDRHGQAAGDELLKGVAARLRACVGDVDMVARLGGDEFTVLCEDSTGEMEAQVIAGRIAAALAQPMDIGEGVRVPAAVSIGIALAGADATPEALLHGADAAMNRVKRGGGGNFAIARPASEASGAAARA